MWDVSYTKDDCNVDAVMDGLGIDRAAVSRLTMSKFEVQQAKEVMKANLQQLYDERLEGEESDQSDAEDEEEETAK